MYMCNRRARYIGPLVESRPQAGETYVCDAQPKTPNRLVAIDQSSIYLNTPVSSGKVCILVGLGVGISELAYIRDCLMQRGDEFV